MSQKVTNHLLVSWTSGKVQGPAMVATDIKIGIDPRMLQEDFDHPQVTF